MTLLIFATLLVAFSIAGFVKGVIGLGLPTVSIGILTLVMTTTQGAAVLFIPALVTNFWQLAAGPRLGRAMLRFATLLLSVFPGAWFGIKLFEGVSPAGTAMVLGFALMVYASLGLTTFRFYVPPKHEPWLGPLMGFFSGALASTTGMFVVPVVPYLQALELEREDLIQVIGLSATAGTLALGGSVLHSDWRQYVTAQMVALALVASLLGMKAGQMLRTRIKAETFRRYFFLGMLVLGCHLIIRGYIH